MDRVASEGERESLFQEEGPKADNDREPMKLNEPGRQKLGGHRSL